MEAPGSLRAAANWVVNRAVLPALQQLVLEAMNRASSTSSGRSVRRALQRSSDVDQAAASTPAICLLKPNSS